jgi:tetratricopeptide (TPR) repeat protein
VGDVVFRTDVPSMAFRSECVATDSSLPDARPVLSVPVAAGAQANSFNHSAMCGERGCVMFPLLMSFGIPLVAMLSFFWIAGPCMAHGDLHELIEKADRGLRVRPDDVQLLLSRACLLREHRDFVRALEDIGKVAKLAPEMPERLIVEARVRADLGQWPAAKVALTSYLQSSPESSEALFLRSKAHAELGDSAAAMSDARAAIGHQTEASVPYHLHLIELARRFGSASQVLQCFVGARRSLGKLPALLEAQAEWHAVTGDRQAAANVYEELREAVPGLAFHTWVAELEMWTGHDNAKAHHARAQAELAWSKLPDRIRQRTAVIEKHDALTRTATSEP